MSAADSEQLRATLARMQEEHARAQATLREQSRLLEILNQTGQSIASQLDIEKLLQTVTDAATSLTGARFGAFFYNRVNESGEDYLLYTLSGAPRAAFEKFSYSHQKEYVDWIESAKTPETRQRRIESAAGKIAQRERLKK